MNVDPTDKVPVGSRAVFRCSPRFIVGRARQTELLCEGDNVWRHPTRVGFEGCAFGRKQFILVSVFSIVHTYMI